MGGAAPSGGSGLGGATGLGGAAPASGGAGLGGAPVVSSGGTPNSAGEAGSGSEAGAGIAGPKLQSGSRAILMFTSQPSCQSVTFPMAFEVEPARLRVLATLVHPGSEITHDASTV